MWQPSSGSPTKLFSRQESWNTSLSIADFIIGALEEDFDPVDDGPISDSQACDWSLSFDSLEGLNNANTPSFCKQFYAMDTLLVMFGSALAKYTDVNNGYDTEFTAYTKYVKQQVPRQLDDCIGWPSGKCLKYFHCEFRGDGPTISGDCPLPNVVPGELSSYSIKYTLKDEDGLYNDLLNSYGVEKSYIKFGDVKKGSSGNSCRAGKMNCEPTYRQWLDRPMSADNYEVTNPKDIVTKALQGAENLKIQLQATSIDIQLGLLRGSFDDALQVMSLPVLLTGQAVESMAQAKEIGEDFAEEEKKNLALTIVSAVFCFVPFVGEAAAAAAGMTTLARLIALVGLTGNAALTIADVMENPRAAPMAILGMLLRRTPGGSAVRTLKGLSDLANIRRGLNAPKIGAFFQKNDGLLQSAVKACKRS
ncbi:THO complex subunit 3 [Elsinoe australis]|uniref:THO complex subunit 3 n=1 Tax=Elsinoe australis TaxID=40998 RepID=A0A2P7Z5X7_9PEZI|nr:THO complex subunit 3 [Elsinoe australis]